MQSYHNSADISGYQMLCPGVQMLEERLTIYPNVSTEIKWSQKKGKAYKVLLSYQKGPLSITDLPSITALLNITALLFLEFSVTFRIQEFLVPAFTAICSDWRMLGCCFFLCNKSVTHTTLTYICHFLSGYFYFNINISQLHVELQTTYIPCPSNTPICCTHRAM